MGHTNPDKQKEYRRKWKSKIREKRNAFLESLKSGGCSDCGAFEGCADCGSTNIITLEFDHVPEKGEKIDCVTRMIGGASNKQFFAEIDKCEVVCSSCHRQRTQTRKGSIG